MLIQVKIQNMTGILIGVFFIVEIYNSVHECGYGVVLVSQDKLLLTTSLLFKLTLSKIRFVFQVGMRDTVTQE